MNPIEKALELRRSVRLRSKEPGTAFHRRLRWPRAILNCIEQHEQNGGLLNEARRQYLVSLCAGYEIYWRDFMKQTIDAQRLCDIDIRELRSRQFSFSDLHQILGQRLTLGELITSSYTFQGTDVVNQVCLAAFNLDLFAKIAKRRFKIEIVEPKTEAQARPIYMEGVHILRYRKAIDRCFAIRHETVHNTGTQYRLSQKTVRELQGSMQNFNLFASWILEGEIEGRQS